MKKILFMAICGLLTVWLVCLTNNNGQNKQLARVGTVQAATATTNITLTTTVLEAISISITSGGTIAFGNLTPGTSAPLCNGSGSVLAVTTNASNGYTMGVSDTSDTNSPLVFNGVYIPDATGGTMTTPVTWTTNGAGFLGLGITNFADATTKNTSKWGTGTTACDVYNKWAGVPASNSVGHTVTGWRASADSSSWGWKIDAPASQITGAYSGPVLFTATSVVA